MRAGLVAVGRCITLRGVRAPSKPQLQREFRRARHLGASVLVLACCGCSSAPLLALDAGGASGMPQGSAGESGDSGESAGAASSLVTVFDHIPQFGIYADTDPDYTPPDGVLVWNHGTEFVTQLGAEQQAALLADLAARITYFAQCDPYDRLGGLFFVLEPKGQTPLPSDPRVELVRFITPFSDYQRGALATHVYPDADLSPYAAILADPAQDVWIGISGGSNPFNGDACSDETGALRAGVSPEFAAVGFSYSVALVSSARGPRTAEGPVVLSAKSNSFETMTPIDTTLFNPGDELNGQLTVIVSGHGSAAGGDEYRHTNDTLILNDEPIGQFNTRIDCAEYAEFSPDGNPNIFQGNLSASNPRNWCPGALVPAHVFEATLAPGMNSVRLSIAPGLVPDGSGYATSISFTGR